MEFQKQQKTNILPLRWFGNICNKISTKFLLKAVYMSEKESFGRRYSLYIDIWDIVDRPYRKWGTYYTADWHKPEKTINDVVKEIIETNSELLNRLGSDYDEDGVPHWVQETLDEK